MPIDGRITSGTAHRATVGTPTVSAEPEPVVDGEGLSPAERLGIAARRDKASRERAASIARQEQVLANRERAIDEYGRLMLLDQVTPDQVQADRREAELEAGRAYFATQLREAIARGGDRYALLAGYGPQGIEDLIARSNAHWQETGESPSIGRLLDDAEDEARAALQFANEGLMAVEQTPEAKKARALSAIDAALSGVRAQEQNGWALRRGAARRGAEAERRTRTKAAIDRAWEDE